MWCLFNPLPVQNCLRDFVVTCINTECGFQHVFLYLQNEKDQKFVSYIWIDMVSSLWEKEIV